MQKNESRPPTYTICLKRLKWVKGLNICCDTIKVLAADTASKISDIHVATFLLIYLSLRAREIKGKK